MNDGDKPGVQDSGRAPVELERNIRVVRSKVQPGLKYPEYRKQLRWDFLYSCAYCTLAESEATAIHFCTDHYEPRSKRPDLENAYDNLMYACNPCNVRKGALSPSDAERQQGFRFFRPDVDLWEEHFKATGIRIEGITNTGRYTELSLDLNRKLLRRLREIRSRAVDAVEYMAQGVGALRQLRIDDLPAEIRIRALQLLGEAQNTQAKLQGKLDELLREYARSKLEDGDEPSDEDIQHNKERQHRLSAMGVLQAGLWTVRRPKKRT